jgi:hypothetical protein
LSVDDLIGDSKTITITKVAIRPGTEQPVTIFYDGDNGRPWKPCKTMCRVLVQAWGPDANHYVGRSVSLYKDAKVTWGGLAVGGIRISHLSHIDRKFITALTVTKGSKKAFEVDVLKMEPKPTPKPAGTQAASKVDQMVIHLLSSITGANDIDSLLLFLGDDKTREQLAYLKSKQPTHFERVDAAIKQRRDELGEVRTPGSDDE